MVAKILVNALASTAGGGLTYLRNILPRFSEYSQRYKFIILLPTRFEAEWVKKYEAFLTLVYLPKLSSITKRIWWEQNGLVRFIANHEVDLLVSLGNFAALNCPVPQILFCRNELYFSDYFKNDLIARKEWKMLLGHQLKTWFSITSLRSSALFVTPTKAMANHLLRAKVPENRISVIPFGFDSNIFAPPSPHIITSKFETTKKKLLYVSHYNYFRNFETLISALALIKARLSSPVELVLTTDLSQGQNYGGYKTDKIAELVNHLKIKDNLRMLGAVEYERLSDLYQGCDVFICPSYAESFGHPMLEAMANKIPIVAADLPVHREVCGGAAVYFSVFNEYQLAEQVVSVLSNSDLTNSLIKAGEERITNFSWDEHIAKLICLFEMTLKG